jgi:hypothetical protein
MLRPFGCEATAVATHPSRSSTGPSLVIGSSGGTVRTISISLFGLTVPGEAFSSGIATIVRNRQDVQLCMNAHMHYVLLRIPLKGQGVDVHGFRLKLIGLRFSKESHP